MSYLLCLAFAAAVAAAVLLRASAQDRRRNEQSWESLAARLRPVWSASDLSDRSSPEERWQLLGGAHGLCAMYRNAKIMLEMANYAAQNSAAMDVELLANLRSDALQIRVLVAGALAEYAVHQVNEGISSNVCRAASVYREMSDRMGELQQVNADGLVPQSIAAR